MCLLYSAQPLSRTRAPSVKSTRIHPPRARQTKGVGGVCGGGGRLQFQEGKKIICRYRISLVGGNRPCSLSDAHNGIRGCLKVSQKCANVIPAYVGKLNANEHIVVFLFCLLCEMNPLFIATLGRLSLTSHIN